MNQTVADYIVQQLKAWGVKRIYGVAGSEIIPLLDAIGQVPELEYIAVRHESAAGFMAATEAKLTGNIGVCIATSGPGLTNLMNGIADGAFDHIPLLAISGQVETKYIGTHHKQYLNQQSLVSPLPLYSEQVTHPDTATSLLLQAMQKAILAKGLTHISVPVDLQSMPCTSKPIPFPQFLSQSNMELDEAQFQLFTTYLIQTNKPVILIGGGARKAVQDVIKLAEHLGAGIVSTLGAKGIVPGSHPHYIGGLGDGGSPETNEVLQAADLLIMIGATWFPKEYIPKQLPVAQIDLRPENISLDKNVLCSLIGKAEAVIPQLLNELPAQKESNWRDQILAVHDQFIKRINAETRVNISTNETNTERIHPAKLIHAIEEHVSEDAIILLDTGEHTIWFNRYFLGKKQHVLFSGKWRSMGYALSAANVAKMIYPEKEVVAIIGDGSFLMNPGELSTSIKYQLPIQVIVVNNHSLVMEERKAAEDGYDPEGLKLQNPDFSQLAQSFGWNGYSATSLTEFRRIMSQNKNFDQPMLIDALCSQVMPPNLQPINLKEPIYNI